MSISSETRKAGPFLGNGVAATFSFGFKVFKASDVLVTKVVIATGVETVLVLNTGYSVTLNADQNVSAGGSITLLSGALGATESFTISSQVANLQPTTLTNAGGFFPTVINDALDRATILVQQIKERLGRSISYPITDASNIATTLPSAAIRANKVLSFDLNGAPAATFSANDVGNAQSNAVAASGFAAAAASSANDASSAANAAEQWAIKFDGTAVAGDFSSKEYAAGNPSGVGSAKQWAGKTSSAVVAGLFSAKEWAIGILNRGVAGHGSAKDWATYIGDKVDDSEYSSKYYAGLSSGYAAVSLLNSRNATGLANYASDSAFVTAKGSPATTGNSYYNTTSNKIRYYNGSAWNDVGSGAGGSKNYITAALNPDFENNSVLPWSVFTTALSNGVPTSITAGGSQITLSAVNINPLAGAYSAQLVKAAANAQGQGFISSSFTIDREDLGKVLTGSFNYEYVSGTFDGSGSSTQSLEIWLFNVTGNYWIQPSGYRGMNQGTGPGKVAFTFQTDAVPANNSYRLAILTAQTATTALAMNFDDFSVGPQTIAIGAAKTDAKSYALAITGTSSNPTIGTTAVNNATWSRDGDHAIISYTLLQTAAGSAGSGSYLFSLPPGLSIDLTKIAILTNGNAAGSTAVGYGQASTTNGANTNFTNRTNVFVYSATQLCVEAQGSVTVGQSSGLIGTSVFPISSSYLGYTFQARVPIAGWSSNVQMSNDTDTRIVDFRGTQTSQAVTASVTDIAFTVDADTHGAWNGTQYKVAVSGDYVAIINQVSNQANNTAALYLDGAFYQFGSSATSAGIQANGMMFLPKLKAGQLISQRSNTTGTVSGSSFAIFKLSGPSAIAASEIVIATYGLTNAQAVAANAAIKYDSPVEDSHQCFNMATGIFTAKAPGSYRATGIFVSNTAGAYFLKVNGTARGYIAQQTGANQVVTGSISYPLKTGDTMQVCPDTSGTLLAPATNGFTNQVTFERKGN